MKIAIIALLSLAVAGCGAEQHPERQSTTSNPDYKIARLFTHDGCTIYRFIDDGRYRYYANCGRSASASWTEWCGKNCTTNVGIHTAIREVE